MLCQFSVKNFRCIKDEIVLDMQAAPITEGQGSVLVDKDGEKFLPLAAIYGPNGGGKSTVLDALYSLFAKIIRPVLAVQNDSFSDETFNSLIKPFKFDDYSSKKPTEFELFFRTTTYEYQYYLSVFRDNIVEEELYHKRIAGRQYTKVFSRDSHATIEVDKIQLKGSLKGYVWKGISPQITLLSYLAITHGDNEVIKDIMEWFISKLTFLDYKRNDLELYMAIPKDDKTKRLILSVLKEMGIDIDDYRVEKASDPHKIKIYTQHCIQGTTYELDLHEESSGTIKLFNSLPHILRVLSCGGTLIADELDAKLHPILLQYLIRLFQSPEINRNKAQLIFTSQDLITMTGENFRRDEIWFAAKNIEESTQLYSLIEFKNKNGKGIRKDAKYNKQYLEGKYGADPFLRKIVDWRVPD